MKKKLRRGMFYSINSRSARGHKGRLVSVKNKQAKLVQVTHHKKVKIKNKIIKTIPLNKNPDKNDSKNADVMPKPIVTNSIKLGKYHPNMKVKDATDKSIFRNIAKRKNKKSR